jgi:transposase-like protein
MIIEHYLGVSGLARQLGVTRSDLSKWLSQYPAASEHPFPEPDVEVDDAPGWALERVPEVELWRSRLPGHRE